MQELYHGPTASFKDLALQLMPQIFREAANERSSESSYVIVVATSGDTGGASLDGFSRHTNIPIIIFYPNEGVSHLQKLQMVTSEGQKTQVVGVEGDFDYCQTALKRILSSRNQINYYQRTYGVTLSSANSINWARLLPQV
jgi:threonine synthase